MRTAHKLCLFVGMPVGFFVSVAACSTHSAASGLGESDQMALSGEVTLENIEATPIQIKNKFSGKCLASQGAEKSIVQEDCEEQNADKIKKQTFQVTKNSGGKGFLIKDASGLCFDLADNAANRIASVLPTVGVDAGSSEAYVIAYKCHGKSNQDFMFEKNGTEADAWSIKVKDDTSAYNGYDGPIKCLDLPNPTNAVNYDENWVKASGRAYDVYYCHGKDNQRFSFKSLGKASDSANASALASQKPADSTRGGSIVFKNKENGNEVRVGATGQDGSIVANNVDYKILPSRTANEQPSAILQPIKDAIGINYIVEVGRAAGEEVSVNVPSCTLTFYNALRSGNVVTVAVTWNKKVYGSEPNNEYEENCSPFVGRYELVK